MASVIAARKRIFMGISVSSIGEAMLHPIRHWIPTGYAKLVFLCCALVMAVGCGSPDEATSGVQRFDKDFEAAVSSDREYDIYWLGREFEAGGLVFTGPEVSDFGSEIEGGGLKSEYLAAVQGVCCVDIEVTMYSNDAWQIALDRRSRNPNRNLEFRDVTVSGTSAQLITQRSTMIPVNALRLVMRIGRTHLEIAAHAAIPLTPTDPQPNPLIDEATFLATVENLRPYPE